MQRKLAFTLGLAVILVLSLSLVNVAFAQLSVGVKKGDWIEYKVTYTGTPVGGHDMDSARMEVLDVQGYAVTVKITSKYANGTTEDLNYTLNMETGKLIDDFIVPADLKVGDKFFDSNFGMMNISKSEQQVYGGANRTVLYGYTNDNTYVWDQATGVSVEGYDQNTNYTIHSVMTATNMWQPSGGAGVAVEDLAIILAVIIIVIVVVAAWYRRRNTVKNAEKFAA